MNVALEKKFSKDFETEITISALLDDGILLALKTGKFVILNPADYSEQHSFEMQAVAPVYKLAFHNGRIYFAGADFKFYCVDKTGAIIWIHEFQHSISDFFFAQLLNQKTNEYQDYVMVCSYDRTFRVLNASTGDYFWAQMAGLGIEYASVGYDADGKAESVFICSDDGTVRRLNQSNGEMSAYFESPKVMRSVFADTTNQVVYAGGDEMVLYVLDYAKLQTKQKIQFDTYIWDLINYKHYLIVQLYSFAFLGDLLADNEISGEPGLVFYDKKAGNLEESARIMNINIQCKQVIDNLLFSGTTGGEIVVIDMEKKVIIARENVGSFINSISVKKQDNIWIIAVCEENGMFSVVELKL